jgi:heat shock protein HslJ
MTIRTRAVASAAALLCIPVVLAGCSPSSQDSTATDAETHSTTSTQEDPVSDNPAQNPSDTGSPEAFVGTSVDPDGNGYLTFNEDGSITGSDACNGIRTTYSVDGSTAQVEPFPTTQMACGDGWTQWLLMVSSVEVRDAQVAAEGTENTEMAVLDAGGEEVGVLVPGNEPENVGTNAPGASPDAPQ